MKIETNKDGKLIIDGIEKDVKDLTVEFLEDVVDKALSGNVDFVLENDALPMTQFFSQIQKGTEEGSVLKTKLIEIDQSLETQNSAATLLNDTYI